MDTKELLKKVRRIEIKSKGLSNQIFSGTYHSTFKGQGMSFSEVREYAYGDDIRHIDWNVTARTGQAHVKIYDEERELTVMLLIDVSQSMDFGLKASSKRDIAAELAAILAFSAINNNDKVGALFFSDRIEAYLPPKKGRQNILRIIREVINITPQSSGSDLDTALKYFANVQKKRCITFLISDFIASDYETPLKLVSQKHDLVGINLFDPFELDFSQLPMLSLMDAETGQQLFIDPKDKHTSDIFRNRMNERRIIFESVFRRIRCDSIHIDVSKDYITSLIAFFKKRA